MVTPSQELPREGDLAAHPLPRVLLHAWRTRLSGSLSLSRKRMTKRVQWQDGVPVFVESNLASESLGIQLVDAERIGRDDLARVGELVKGKGIREGAALLELKLLEPKELFLALRDQVRRRIVDCFGWPDGSFAIEQGGSGDDETQAFRVDPLGIVQHGLANHWSPERMLADLEPALGRHPVPSERYDALARRLAGTPEADALLAAIDPERTFGEAVYASLSAPRLAAAWLLAETGALDFADQPPSAAADGDAAEAEGPEFQFEVRGEADAAAADAGETTAPIADGLSPEAEALRKDILERHERLSELDHYELLGLPADAPDRDVKKAYFALAKRFHPDALGRVGLSELHRETNELFARIAEAYQTLADPKRRHAYDESRAGSTPSNEGNRLAQAETLFRKGEVLLKVGNFGAALDFLRPCVELWPEEADYQAAFGWALYKQSPSDPEAARPPLEKAHAMKAEDPVTCFRLGVVLRKLGETEAATALLEQAKTLEKRARA